MFLFGATLHDGRVATLTDVAVPSEAQFALRVGVFGKDEDARGVLVETVADVSHGTRVLLLQVLGEQSLCRLLAGVAPHGEQSGSLLHHDEVLVLVDNLQLIGTQHGKGAGEVHRHLVARSKRCVKLRRWASVHGHMVVGQHRLDVALALGRQYHIKEGQQRSVLYG